MQQQTPSTSEGFNQWTVPWETPSGDDIDALREGRYLSPDFPVEDTVMETFQRDGVAFLPGAFAEWVDRLRAGLARNLSAPERYRFPAESTAAGEPGRFFDSYCNWTLIPEYREFVFRSGAAALAGKLMRSSIAQFFHEHVFIKQAGTRKATPWHQDIPYYCVDGEQSCSVYVALDDVPEEVTVRFVKGSHRWGQTFYPKVWLDSADFNVGDSGYDGPVPDTRLADGGHDIASWPLRAGDTIVFSFKTLHGTSDAPMRNDRSAFSTRWMGDDMRYLERPGETSPPFVDTGMTSGDRMREDWFPILWRRPGG